MGGVAGNRTDKVDIGLQSLLSVPDPATDATLLGKVLFAFGGGGGGAEGLCRWGGKVGGGRKTLLGSFSMVVGGRQGRGFMGSELVGLLLCNGMGGGGPLWRPEEES